MRLHEIGQFYAEHKGWRMFDSAALTPEIKRYLVAEAEFLAQVMSSGFRTLIEVGCGYGRYIDWSAAGGYDYVGLDIVAWLVELAQLRAQRARQRHPSFNCRLLQHPAEEIGKAVRELSLSRPRRKPLIFFPFNCLGNVSRFDSVADGLQHCGADVLVSTFRTDATSTKIRKEYYGQCGFEKLNSRLMKQGLLMISDEGFHAMAYHEDWLLNAFRKRGFTVKKEGGTGVGALYQFSRKEESAAKVESPPDVSTADKESREAVLYIVEGDGQETGAAGTISDAHFLRLKESEAVTKFLSSSEMQAVCLTPTVPGSFVRIVVSISADEISSGVWHDDLFGEITQCRQAIKDDRDSYVLTIRLDKPAPQLFKGQQAFG